MSEIGGLGGGSAGSITGQLDVQWIVEQLIYAKQQPIRDLEVFETWYEAKREAFQELNTKVSSVESALYDLKSSGFSSKNANLSSEDYLTASASTSAASDVSYSIVVKQLAQAESYTSDNAVTDADDTTIFDALGSKQFTITPRDGSDAETIDVTGMSLNQLKTEINSLDIGATASVINYDTNDNRLVITADETGEDNGFTLSGDAAVTTLGMDQKIANQDARISVNNPGVYISRESNTITDVISGVTLNLKDFDDAETDATILTIGADTTALRENIGTFVDAYNETMDYLNAQFTYDEENERAGVLSGETGARKVKDDLLRLAVSRVAGIDADESYSSFSIIGLEMNRQGQLEINDEKLDDAIDNHLDSVERIFKHMGTSDSAYVNYIGESDDTVAGRYEVVISQAAEQATVTGDGDFTDLTGAEVLTIELASGTYTVNLTDGMDSADVISAVNSLEDDDGYSVSVYARMSGSKLQILTDDYGSSQTLTVSSNLGAGSMVGFTAEKSDTGQDVIGTIGGNAATGSGKRLTGTAGDSEGLIVTVSATTTGSVGEVYFTRGVGETLRERMYEHSFPYSGLLAKNIDALDDQLQGISDKIAAINRQLASEQDILITQFTKANEALSQMEYLLSQISNNFS
jgi:flagellar hook-associated protein 2